MNLIEYAQRLLNAKALIVQQRARIALQAAFDLNATIQLRIQEKGEDSQGQQFSPYTKRYAQKGRKDLGYQSEYVDFTRTGRMFNNIQPQVVNNTQDNTLVVITARDTEQAKKLRGQGKKRGNIIYPSKTEIIILSNQYSAQILSLIKTKI